MASTYSTNLRLENIATGEQSGTWGDSTDNNICVLLEQAITGVAAVAQGDVADKTLTASNGVVDESRNMVISITGALTAARNVVVPTADKLYIFSNDTTGGFNITIKTAAGTGIAISPGQKMLVYCDATNVVNGLNAMSASVGWMNFVDAGATGAQFRLFHDSSSPANSDVPGKFSIYGRDSAGNQQEWANWFATITDVTSTSEDATMTFQVVVAGTLTNRLTLNATGAAFTGSLVPESSDGAALGTTALQWSDVFLAEGGVINWDNGDATITQTSNLIAFGGITAITPSANDGAALGAAGTAWSDLFLAEGGVINWDSSDATITQTGNAIQVAGITNFGPGADDGSALGVSGTAWSDLFLASGSVINFAAGDATITHAANALTFSGAAIDVVGTLAVSDALSSGSFSSLGSSSGWDSTGSGLQNSSNTLSSAVSHYRFYNPNGLVGSISTNGSATAFTTSSDATLKDDMGEMPLAVAEQIIRAIVIHDFKWKVDGTADIGVFAQELHALFPQAVTVGGFTEVVPGRKGRPARPGRPAVEAIPFRKGEDGEPDQPAIKAQPAIPADPGTPDRLDQEVYVPWAVDYSKLVTPLARTLQGVLDRLDVLEGKGSV